MQLLQVSKVSYTDNTYILDGALLNPSKPQMAFSTSDQTIRLYDTTTTAFIREFKDHNKPITDLVTCPFVHPSLMFSSQEDSGVMICDVRQAQPSHFLTEMTTSGMQCSSLSVRDDGHMLALATDGHVQFIDTRTWCSVKTMESLHMDEITRLRYGCGPILCSAGEDQMVNVLHTECEEEDDMMMHVVSYGEVVTKLSFVPPTSLTQLPPNLARQGMFAMVGSCENALVISLEEVMNPEDGSNTAEHHHRRPDYSVYQVDFVPLNDRLYLLSGVKDEDGNAGPIALAPFPAASPAEFASGRMALNGGHTEVVRVALSLGERIITGGEDGSIAIWREGGAAASSSRSSQDYETSSDRSAGGTMKAKAGKPAQSRRGNPY